MSSGRTTEARRSAYRRGHWAEALVASWLRLKGYRVLARRYQCPLGEIDLIVRRGRMIAFVEVKARRDHDTALEAVGLYQRRRILQAAKTWMARADLPGDCTLRFDLVLVSAAGLPKHMENAFGEE